MKARYRKYFMRNIMSVRDDFATYYVQDSFARRDTIFGVELMRYFSHRDTVEWLTDCLAFDHCARYELRSFLSENGPRRYLLHRMDDRKVIDEVARVLMDGNFPVVVRPECEPPWRQSELIDLLHEIRDGRSETEPVPGATGKRFQFKNLMVNRWPEVALDGSVLSNIKNMPEAVFNTLVNELVVDVSNAFLWDAQYVQDHGFKKWLSDGLKKQWDLVRKDTKKLEELARTGPNELLWYLTSDALWDDIGNQLKSVFYAESWKNAFAILIPVALLRKIGGGKRAGSGSAARRGASATRKGTKRRTKARSAANPKHRQKSATKTGPETITPKKLNPLDDPKIAKEIQRDPNAVNGYSPKPGSSLDKFKIDWSNPKEVEFARSERIKYLEKLKKKKKLLENEVETLKKEGMSMEDIARKKVQQRNQERIDSYIKSDNIEGLKAMKERNLIEYGRAEGPTADQLFESKGSWEEVIFGSVKSSAAMDVLTGLY